MGDETKSVFKMSVDTELLIRALRERPVGSVVTYQELCAITNRTKAKLNGVLRTAIENLWALECYWATVFGVGVKRVTESEAMYKPVKRRDRIKRQAVAAGRELSSIRFEALSAEDKMIHIATALAMKVHKAAETPRARRRLLEAVADIEKKLTMQEAAAALLDKKRKKAQ